MTIQEGTARLPGHTDVTIAESQSVASEKNLKEIFVRAKNGREINFCPVRDIIARFSDRWSLLTLLLLGAHGRKRFSEIKSGIGDVSQRMLTVTLRHLEEDGFITREVFAEVPPRVEYELTILGRELVNQLTQFTAWIDTRSDDIVKARKKIRR